MVDSEHKISYDKNYIEQLYINYMSKGEIYDKHLAELISIIADKSVLLICPGKSSETEKDKIVNCADGNVTISVNFNYPHTAADFLFVSNLRRFKQLDKSVYGKTIVTSNVSSGQIFLRVDYAKLLNEQEGVRDNAGLMAIALFIGLGVKKIYLAGFDGFSHESDKNYAESKMELVMKKAMYDVMNVGMQTVLDNYSCFADIEFVTSECYIHSPKEVL
jgi:4-hydroxy 2-oxovalerate aldolase